jgi:uncharacterized protein
MSVTAFGIVLIGMSRLSFEREGGFKHDTVQNTEESDKRDKAEGNFFHNRGKLSTGRIKSKNAILTRQSGLRYGTGISAILRVKFRPYSDVKGLTFMDCVACKNPLVVLELEGVEIDYCLECSGLWLDAGELELLMKDASEHGAFLASIQENPSAKETPRNCPICAKKMRKVFCGESQKIQIDECPKKHGLWCDGGELETILRATDAKNPRVLNFFKEMFKHKTEGGTS